MYSDIDRYYSPKEISEMLKFEPVTLRKYSIALEKAGYIFIRNENDHRLYTERDVVALQHLKALRDHNALNVDNAAMAVATRFMQVNEPLIPVAHDENPQVFSSDIKHYETLQQKIDAQAEQIAELLELNRLLLDRLNERDQKINELVNNFLMSQHELANAKREDDRDRKLTEVLRMLQETKEYRTRSVFARLFGRL